ncbi:MAG: oligosaccharide flippase family protein [Muribaculaceae bacterium]|nr:oligosaccharide flippase family protein [Muribaculaceae bacterium]
MAGLLKKNCSDNSLFKNILKLISGEGVGRAIGFLAAPVITRLYTTSDFGIVAVFGSICVLLYPFLSLKYSLSIPLHRTETAAVNSIAACLLVLVINTVIITLTFLFFHSQILSFFSSGIIDSLWGYIPLTFFFCGLSEILSYYSTRQRDFTTIAKVSIVQKLTGALIKIFLGLLHCHVIGLLTGSLFAASGGLSLYFRVYWKRLKDGFHRVSLRKICFVIRRYKEFPLYRVPSHLLLKVSGSLPILYFAWHFGTDTTGQISLAMSMLSVPVSIACTSVGRAFYGEIASLGQEKNKEISVMTGRIMIKLFAISIVPFMVIVVFGPWIFSTYFGSEWIQSGVFARYLCFYLIFRFVYSPISDGIFNVFERQKSVLWLETSRVVIVISSLFISWLCNCSVDKTVIVYSLSLSIQYIFSIIMVFYILRKSS